MALVLLFWHSFVEPLHWSGLVFALVVVVLSLGLGAKAGCGVFSVSENTTAWFQDVSDNMHPGLLPTKTGEGYEPMVPAEEARDGGLDVDAALRQVLSRPSTQTDLEDVQATLKLVLQRLDELGSKTDSLSGEVAKLKTRA